MKKNFKYALLGAVALTGAMTFSACQSSDEIVDNPNYNPDKNTVKTEFTISIPTSGGQATRMSADGAPNNDVFKGIKEINLYPITTINATTKAAEASSTMLTPISLEAITAFNEKGSGDNSFNGKVYEDVTVPIGTKAFLFYGEIANEEGGDLTPTYPTYTTTPGTPEDVHFALVPIQNATFSNVSSDAQGTAVLAALNGVVGVLTTQEHDAETASHASATQLNALLQSFQALKAGSANSVKAFMENAYSMLTTIGGDYASAVKTKYTDYFTVDGSTLTWKKVGSDDNIFPNNLGLPDGAVGLNYSSGAFSFANVAAGGNTQPELTTYVKPASLFYTVNTPLHTSTAAQVANYAAKTSWDDVVALYDDTEVKSSTRGIVLDKPIQYGVGRLKSQVILAASLKANDGNGGEAAVTAPGEGYTVSGILIGGQKNVDWKFEPPTAAEEEASQIPSYTIYDPVQTVSGTKASTTASAPNYTLALQTAKDAEIKVVVELVNNGENFYGIEDRLIPAGSKFYLIAKLKPSEGTLYDANDDTKNRVFCQDVETSVVFEIGENSLKKAYNTIPDLRAAKMELGLSVNLEWKTGLEFNTTFGN